MGNDLLGALLLLFIILCTAVGFIAVIDTFISIVSDIFKWLLKKKRKGSSDFRCRICGAVSDEDCDEGLHG